MATTATNIQIPDHAILDFFNKQNYLGNAYTVSTNKQTIGSTGETALIALSNPISNLSTNKQNGSLALFLGLRKYIQANNFTTASLFRIYLNPTFTVGSTLTPINLRSGSAFTSKMTAKLSPTVSVNGTFMMTNATGSQEADSSNLIILDPGSSILVTVQCGTSSTDVITELSWYEI